MKVSVESIQQDRITGSLQGLAVGDALGTTIEFARRDTVPVVTDIVGGGPFQLEAGQWTDDTSMALCIAASLAETGAYDPKDQLKRFVHWRDKGYMSSNGRCFDIGTQTRGGLHDYECTGEPYRADTSSHKSGNGSLMRLAPVPMAFSDNIKLAGELSADSSQTTHPSIECQEACGTYGQLIASAISGSTKEELYEFARGLADTVTSLKIANVLNGSYRSKTRDEISSSGYVVNSLEAALWAFANSDNFEQGALLAVNLADDADTVGAIYGQLAGAYYGKSGIPERWIEKLYAADMIESLAKRIAGKIGTYAIKSVQR
jgi:ADP-ribosyl-[dinitrogen reductase] hydrolase